MSLVITLRAADGIVMAADSLSTVHHFVGPHPLSGVKCDNCGKEIDARKIPVPSIAVPVSASSYTQKLFSLFNKLGVSSHGLGVINERSVFYHIKQFESQYREKCSNELIEKVKDLLLEYIAEQFNQWEVFTSSEAPADWNPLGLHLSGFDFVEGKPEMKTYRMNLGKQNKTELLTEIGSTYGGSGEVVGVLWELSKKDPRYEFAYPLYSLQDAIDHVEFLIAATRDFQRFSNMNPMVGGEIDIALITPYRGFQWIRRKGLMKILEVR